MCVLRLGFDLGFMCIFYILLLIWFSVPVQLIVWQQDSSLKWPVICRVGR